jgi:hypothetical protein
MSLILYKKSDDILVRVGESGQGRHIGRRCRQMLAALVRLVNVAFVITEGYNFVTPFDFTSDPKLLLIW